MFSNFEEDPIESAGLFEGDIDNVSMDDLQSTDTRVSKGFLKFSKKDKNGKGAKKDFLITNETIDIFKVELKQLILEICNPNIPFTEKEI